MCLADKWSIGIIDWLDSCELANRDTCPGQAPCPGVTQSVLCLCVCFYHGPLPVREGHGHGASCFSRRGLTFGEVGFGGPWVSAVFALVFNHTKRFLCVCVALPWPFACKARPWSWCLLFLQGGV